MRQSSLPLGTMISTTVTTTTFRTWKSFRPDFTSTPTNLPKTSTPVSKRRKKSNISPSTTFSIDLSTSKPNKPAKDLCRNSTFKEDLSKLNLDLFKAKFNWVRASTRNFVQEKKRKAQLSKMYVSMEQHNRKYTIKQHKQQPPQLQPQHPHYQHHHQQFHTMKYVYSTSCAKCYCCSELFASKRRLVPKEKVQTKIKCEDLFYSEKQLEKLKYKLTKRKMATLRKMAF
jgi:hypothetical protein